MSLLLSSIDYTDRDFDSLRRRLVALTLSVFPDWDERDVASFGNLLVEMFAFVGDVSSFYADALARESRLSTATQRKNVIALARMLGYRLHGAAAATADVVFRLARPAAADVVIRAGTIVRTQEVTEPLEYQLLSTVRIPVGSDATTGLVEHSRTHTQRFDTRALPDLDVELDHTPYLDRSALVAATNGVYSEVGSLLGSGPNDRHVMVLVDQNDRATLRFGNGTSGARPTGSLEVIYKTGGGTAGNVEAGRLRVVEGTFADENGRPVQLEVENPDRASGGIRRQTTASAKLRAPESLRALTRTVSREDFEINARRLPGVARALMLTSNEDPGIEENSGILFVIPEGGGVPTPALKNQVFRQVTEVYPCTLTFGVRVQDPVYRTIHVEARVYLREGQAHSALRQRLQSRLEEMFRVSHPDGTPNPTVDFGFNVKDQDGQPAGEVALSDVFNQVRDTVGVRKIGDRHGDVKLNGLPADVSIGLAEFPVLGTLTLVDGSTGGLF